MATVYQPDFTFDGSTIPQSCQTHKVTVVGGNLRYSSSTNGPGTQDDGTLSSGLIDDPVYGTILYKADQPGDGLIIELDFSLAPDPYWEFYVWIESPDPSYYLKLVVTPAYPDPPTEGQIAFSWGGGGQTAPPGEDDIFVTPYDPVQHRFFRLVLETGGYWSLLVGPTFDAMATLTGIDDDNVTAPTRTLVPLGIASFIFYTEFKPFYPASYPPTWSGSCDVGTLMIGNPSPPPPPTLFVASASAWQQSGNVTGIPIVL